MGFMTTVGILNDRLHDLAANPQRFVDQLVEAIQNDGKGVSMTGQTTVLPSNHADNPTVTLAYGNCFIRVTSGIETMSIGQLKRRVMFAELACQTAQGDRRCVERLLLEEIMKQANKANANRNRRT